MLAHGTGIDDLAVIAGAVVLYLIVSTVLRRGPDAEGRDAARPSACPYCEVPVPAAAARCSSCGFRVPRATPDSG
jgi:hypothetical protein